MHRFSSNTPRPLSLKPATRGLIVCAFITLSASACAADEKPQVEVSVETLSPDQIFSEIEGIVRATLEGREQKRWLYIMDRLRNDNIIGVDTDDFVKLVLADNGKILSLLSQLPKEDFTELYILIENAVSKAELVASKTELAASKADLEYVDSLPGMDK